MKNNIEKGQTKYILGYLGKRSNYELINRILSDHVIAAQNNFAMMARDRRVGDLKRIVIHTTNRGCVHI